MVDCAFFFNFVRDDLLLAKRLLSQLDQYHCNCRVIAVSDGPTEPIAPVNQKQTIIYSEHLKKIETIGQYIKRNFNAVLNECDSEWIVKVDPDSYFMRPISTLPSSPCWAGARACRTTDYGHTTWIKGGAFAMHRTIVQQLATTELLDEPRYHYLHYFEIKQNRVYSDFRIGHIAQRLNVCQDWWHEISHIEKGKSANLSAAIIHPVKELKYQG